MFSNAFRMSKYSLLPCVQEIVRGYLKGSPDDQKGSERLQLPILVTNARKAAESLRKLDSCLEYKRSLRHQT